MGQNAEAILGRDEELARLHHFIRAISSGPSALLLEGAAGIGKTTLWRAGVDHARASSLRVLSCRAAESEARLSYAGLGDLFDFQLPELPAPQQSALGAALLRVEIEGSAPDQRAVSVASLAALRALASAERLIIAVDDIQWLDKPSAKVLSFVVRRLEHERVGILLTLRAGSSDPLRLGQSGLAIDLHQLSLGPLSENAMTRLLRDRTGTGIMHPTLLRMHKIAAGNPYFALEIARALLERAVHPAPGEQVPVPESIQELLGARLAALPRDAIDALLVIAAASRPTEELVLAAAPQARAYLERVERANIVQRAQGRIEFTHPLLGSTVYATAKPDARRTVHRKLADLVVDQEERARHLALASTGPDPGVARTLEEAATHARARGAPDAAAELLDLAVKVTPLGDSESVLRRTVQAAEYRFESGDATRATRMLEEAIEAAVPGPERAFILFRLASISWLHLRRVQELCEQALDEGDDLELRASLLEHLAWVGIYRGDLSFAFDRATRAVESARGIDDPAVGADPLATFGMVEFLRGRPRDDLMMEAVRLQDKGMSGPGTEPTVYTTARSCYGLQLLWAGELAKARELLHQELAGYERRGRYLMRDELLCYLAEVECRAGNWDAAARHAHEAYEIDLESGRLLGQGHMLFPVALVAALRGEEHRARSCAEEGLRQCLRNDDTLDASCNGAVLGFLELSLANPLAAMERLDPVLAFLKVLGSPEPGVIPCLPDAIEALVSLGRLAEAQSLLHRLEEQGRTLDRPWAVATAARCRGLLTAARGDLPLARQVLEQAVVDHEKVPQPFELGRTLVVKGEVERRAKQKRASRATLGEAVRIFETLGAPLWAQRAQASLARVGGGRPSSAGRLTPTEQRIADLVAEGQKNHEIAASLFISVKTVEANLSRIFHKRAVRSRTELTRQMAAEKVARSHGPTEEA